MRIVTKKELLALKPPVLFREWCPCAYNDEDWIIKTGDTFGACMLSPDPDGSDCGNDWNIWDWDGDLDVEDNETFVVAERTDIEVMINRLGKCLDAADSVVGVGESICDYDTVRENNSAVRLKGWYYKSE